MLETKWRLDIFRSIPRDTFIKNSHYIYPIFLPLAARDLVFREILRIFFPTLIA